MNKIIKRSLPHRFKEVMHDFSDASQEKRFILFGGSVSDLIFDNACAVKDWDFGIFGLEKKEKSLEILQSNGCQIIRSYLYRLNHGMIYPVAEVRHPKWGIWDIAFIDSLNFLGPFNFDSLYVSYPELRIYDTFNVMNELGKSQIKFVRYPLSDENPLILFKRLLVIMAKYNISVTQTIFNRKIIETINEMLMKGDWRHEGLYGDEVVAACFDKLLDGIFRCSKPYNYFAEVIEFKITSTILKKFVEFSMRYERSGYRHIIDQPNKLALLSFMKDEDVENKLSFLFELLKLRGIDI